MEAFELDIVPWSLYFDGLRPNIETDGPIDRSAWLEVTDLPITYCNVTSINKNLLTYGRVIEKISFQYSILGHINILIGTRQSRFMESEIVSWEELIIMLLYKSLILFIFQSLKLMSTTWRPSTSCWRKKMMKHSPVVMVLKRPSVWQEEKLIKQSWVVMELLRLSVWKEMKLECVTKTLWMRNWMNSNNQFSFHPMVIKWRKHKVKLFFSNGSVQQVGDEREVESPDSLDCEIRQGNLR